MQLTEGQKKRLEEILLSKWFVGGPKCPVCQKNDWTITPQIFEIQDFRMEMIPDNLRKKTFFPVVIMVCNECKYCLTFSAIALGLFQHDLLKQDPMKDATKEPAP